MVMYVPDRGDVVWLQFDPQSGHEQAGRRPALTLSPKAYNEKVGLAIFCPVTSYEKGYPFEVRINEQKIKGVILADQVKSLDWKMREAEFIVKAPLSVTNEVIELLSTLVSYL
jgi:mRNA interferase MazF